MLKLLRERLRNQLQPTIQPPRGHHVEALIVYSSNKNCPPPPHTHTKEKSFMCSECSRGYSHHDHLVAHLKSKHGTEQSKHRKRFQCLFCDGPFSPTFNQLNTHCEKQHKENLGKISEHMDIIILKYA